MPSCCNLNAMTYVYGFEPKFVVVACTTWVYRPSWISGSGYSFLILPSYNQVRTWYWLFEEGPIFGISLGPCLHDLAESLRTVDLSLYSGADTISRWMTLFRYIWYFGVEYGHLGVARSSYWAGKNTNCQWGVIVLWPPISLNSASFLLTIYFLERTSLKIIVVMFVLMRGEGEIVWGCIYTIS